MEKWSIIYVNDPNSNFDIVMELLYEDEDFAWIKKDKEGISLIFFPNKKGISIPINWLESVLKEAKREFN